MKTWEMIKALHDNPKLKATKKGFEKVVFAKSDPFCIGFISDNCGKFYLLDMCESDLNADWELVREPVDFMTAVKAFDAMTTIECRGVGEKRIYKPSADRMRWMRDQHGVSITSDEILNGKWFVE